MAQQQKKVLIISYYWPPAGGPGVQRVVKFAKYLPQFGWDPVILTVRDGEYPAIDPTLEAEIPERVKVYKTSSLEFFSLFKRLTGRKKEDRIATTILKEEKPRLKDRIFRWIRYNFFIPDARVGWVQYAVEEGRRILREEQPAVILCTSPPHSAQLIARRLSKESGIPWVADFRDPWTDAYWLRALVNYPRAYRKNLRLERAVLREANAVITVSKGYQQLLDKEDRPIHLITNGYDSSDFKIRKRKGDNFRIVYTGSLSQIQNPVNLFRAIQRLSPKEKMHLKLHFYGAIDPAIRQSVRDMGIEGVVDFHAYIPHDQITEKMINPEMLLLLTPRTPSKGMTPLKLFEYLATRNYILGIGDVNSDPARILRRCAGGTYHSYEENLLPLLRERMNAWREGKTFSGHQEEIEKLDRKVLTSKLATVLDQVALE